MVTKSLAQLEAEVKKVQSIIDENGIQISYTGRGGGIAKRDLINALAKVSLIQQYGAISNCPMNLAARLSFESPELAYQYTRLKPEEQDDLFSNPNVRFTQKIDGVRIAMIYTPKCGFSAFSRNISEVDFLPPDYGEKILDAPQVGQLSEMFAIDCEIECTTQKISTILRNKGVQTETQLQAVTALLSLNTEESLLIQREQAENQPLLVFRPIDVYYWKGDQRKKVYKDRMANMPEIIEFLNKNKINTKQIPYCDDPNLKKAFLEGIISAGGEGVVAVRLDSMQNLTVNRQRTGMIKIKRSVSGSLLEQKLGDNIDGFITGFHMASEDKGFSNLIGALHISVFLQMEDGTEKEHEIAHVANIPLSLRKKITVPDGNGGVTLDPSYLGKVCTVDGQAVSARAMRLTHPRLIEIREDKSKYDCILSETFIKSLIV